MSDLRKAAEMVVEAWNCSDYKKMNKAMDEMCQALAMERFSEVNQEIEEALAQPEQDPVAKVWLWRNFVNDKPEYWAFDNPYPINLDNDDPQTIGSPCGYALLKPSRDGSRGRKEDEVLREIKCSLAHDRTHHQASKTEQPEQEPVVYEEECWACGGVGVKNCVCAKRALNYFEPPVDTVNTSQERVDEIEKRGHDKVAHLWECIGRWAAMIAHDGEDANLAPPDWLVDAVKAATTSVDKVEQEPVAWMDEDGDVLSASIVDGKGLRNIPLYTATPKREWVGLTVDEFYDLDDVGRKMSLEYGKKVEAKLKEKNGG